MKKVNINELKQQGDIAYVVYKEHTLGYIDLSRPDRINVLQALIRKGAGWHFGNDPIMIVSPDEARLASSRDFEEFNIYFNGDKKDSVYRYIFNETEEPIFVVLTV